MPYVLQQKRHMYINYGVNRLVNVWLLKSGIWGRISSKIVFLRLGTSFEYYSWKALWPFWCTGFGGAKHVSVINVIIHQGAKVKARVTYVYCMWRGCNKSVVSVSDSSRSAFLIRVRGQWPSTDYSANDTVHFEKKQLSRHFPVSGVDLLIH